MKLKNLQTWLISLLVSYGFGFAAVSAMSQGYQLNVDLGQLALWCLLISALFVVLMIFTIRSWLVLGTIALFLILVAPSAEFQQQFPSLLYTVWEYFFDAYGFEIPDLLHSYRYASHLLPLLTIHGLITLSCTWALMCRAPLTLAVFMGTLTFGSCFGTLDTLPPTLCIIGWLFFLALMLMTQPVRQRDPGQADRLTRLLALPLALFFLLSLVLIPPNGQSVPQVPDDIIQALSDWFTGNGNGNGSGNSNGNAAPDQGLSTTLNLSQLGPRQFQNTTILKLNTSYSGKVYLRVQDFDQYTGTSWESSGNRKESNFSVPGLWATTLGTATVQPSQAVDYQYLPCYPSQAPTFVGGSLGNADNKTAYQYTVQDYQDNWQAQWRQGTRIPSESIPQKYLALPQNTLAQAQDLVFRIPGMESADPLEKARLIWEFVHSAAPYDEATAPMPGGQEDFAIWFLTEAETGYCVHYATAAVVLLRSIGIPARYVSGYATNIRANAPVTVRDRQSHAWVEYYIDGAGWLMMDPTGDAPGSDVSTPPTTEPTTQPTTEPSTDSTEPSTDPTAEPTTEPSTEPTTEPTTQPTTEPTTHQPSTQPSGTKPKDPGPKWLLPVVLTAMCLTGLALLVLGQYGLRRWLKGRKLRRGDPNAQALTHYRAAKQLSKHSKLPIPDALTDLAEKARFSQHTLTQEELAIFTEFFHACTNAIAKKNLFTRFYLRFLLALY